MSCIECTNCPSIGSYDICCAEITVAEGLTPATDYLVRILDLTLNRYTQQTVTSSGLGELTIAIDQYTFSPNRTYEVTVHADETCNVDDDLEFGQPGTGDDVYCVSFTLFYAD
jgi:hypothetical protein